MSEKDNMFEGIGETIEVEIENKEALDELFNEVNKENLEIQKRFAEGIYTEDDLLNHLPHFGIGTKDKIELYLVESKYFEDLANRYINLKEIEQSHKEENGKLRVELEQEKEKNKELLNSKIGVDLSYDDYISKYKIQEMKEFYINEHTNKNITLIPLKNIIENINILLEEK